MAKPRIYYYQDELNDDFAGNSIQTKALPKDFCYTEKNVIFRVGAFILYYIIAKPIVWLIMKAFYGARLKNRKVLRQLRNQSYFIYANHTADMLDAYRPNTLRWRRNYIIANPDAFSIKGIGAIVKMLGAIPIVENDLRQNAKLIEAIEKRLNQKASITIYPERHIWPYYTKIRPYPAGPFHYPVKFNQPVIVLTTTYHRHKGLLSFIKRPYVIQYLDGPFYPDQTLSKAEAKIKLRNQVYDVMCTRSNQTKQYEYRQYIKKEM